MSWESRMRDKVKELDERVGRVETNIERLKEQLNQLNQEIECGERKLNIMRQENLWRTPEYQDLIKLIRRLYKHRGELEASIEIMEE